MVLSHLLIVTLLCTGGGGTTKRQAWDMKGRVSDMEVKIRNYQTKMKTVNQENEVLRSSAVQSETKVAEMQKELERQRSQIRCKDHFIKTLYITVVIVVSLICLFGYH